MTHVFMEWDILFREWISVLNPNLASVFPSMLGFRVQLFFEKSQIVWQKSVENFLGGKKYMVLVRF